MDDLPDKDWWPLKWRDDGDTLVAEIEIQQQQPITIYKWPDTGRYEAFDAGYQRGGAYKLLPGLLELRCFLLDYAKNKKIWPTE